MLFLKNITNEFIVPKNVFQTQALTFSSYLPFSNGQRQPFGSTVTKKSSRILSTPTQVLKTEG